MCCKNRSYNAEECYSEIFETNEDASICQEFDASDVNELSLRFNCYRSLAINLEKPELCEETLSRTNYCYFDVAVTLNDESICNSLEGRYSFINENNYVTNKGKCLGVMKEAGLNPAP